LGGELSAKVRFGKIDQEYRLGDRVMFTGWIRFKKIQWVKPSLLTQNCLVVTGQDYFGS